MIRSETEQFDWLSLINAEIDFPELTDEIKRLEREKEENGAAVGKKLKRN
jgi:hypothetical protein